MRYVTSGLNEAVFILVLQNRKFLSIIHFWSHYLSM